LDVKVDLKKESVLAPVKKDEVLGSISVTYDGADYGSANLVAVSDVELSSLALVFYTIKSFFDSILVRLLIAAFVAIVVFRYLRALRRTPRRKNLNDPGEQVKPLKGKAGKSKAANGNAAKSKPVGSKPAAKKPNPSKSPRPRQ
jgi:D-alanyl-D-alanine carboxypeptidase (penicillin-binding protein 5/6)